MTINKIWTFLSMVQFLLCTSVMPQSNSNFQENIAANKSVTQSSNLIFPNNTHSVWAASNAVDGNKDCAQVDKDHYSGTANELVSWWQVDLGNIYSISTIIVYGRPNEKPVQLKGFQVYLLTLENSTDKRHIYNNTNYVNGVFRIPVQPNLFGRYVRIEMLGTYRKDTKGPLVLCEVEVYPTDVIQENKTTVTPAMSSRSTYMEDSIHWDESRAIDGVNDFSPDSCSCCSGTNGADIPWWRLALPKPYIIAQVMVYGRSDAQNVQQSSNLFVYGSNSTTENGTLLYQGNPNREGFLYSINLRPPRLFRILTIRRWISGLMTICEVKMFQAGCPPGFFGDKCLRRCNCRNGVACDVNTGHCDMCPPGFIGDICQTPCHHSTYGYNCNETCDTCIQMECRNTDGKCSAGCVPGYTPTDPYCKKACPVSTYGINCSQTCNTCKDMSCNNTDGLCYNGCVPGYKPDDPYCKKACHHSTYGYNCNETCDTCIQTECRNTDGKCSAGCVPGYTPTDPYCKKACPVSTYGINCSQTCNTCKDMSCNNTDGLCYNGCVPGYKPDDPYCKKECDHSRYGKNCSQICSTCGGMSCNNRDGLCYKGCVPGYTPADPYCKTTCPTSTYSINCSQTCSTCKDKSCYNTDGLCYNGCVPGYKPDDPYCKKVCPPSTYGKNCSQTCNTCENMSCNNTDGLCFNGCVPGYTFEDLYCNTTCPASTYGRNCSQICVTCEDMSCNYTDGLCFNSCVPGYKFDDHFCKTSCMGGTFGRNCNSSCHCANINECNKVNGTCFDNMCAPEWKGPSCQVLDITNVELSDSSQSHSGAIGGGVGATVAVVITAVIIGFIIYRRRNVNKSSDRESQFTNLDTALDSRRQTPCERHESSMTESVNRSSEGEEETAVTQSGTGDYYSFGENFGGIRIYELWDCIKEKMENECEKFYSEFKTLPSGLVHPSKSADNLVNRGKNRYKEMYAYDHTRVVLDVEESTHTDYINACYIDGYDKTKKFVASQGPTKQMIDDFWRMVWQLKSDKIVMLTDLIEMGTIKCLQYWPLEDEEDEHRFGKVIVRVLKTESFLDYNIRLFEVRKNGESARKIRQYHFKSWPDKDVPDSTWCLVNFWRAVNTNEPSTAGPIVVHCSAGVGRTGTFIALDNIVSQAKAEGCVRPLQVVETLRRQRVNMVQTREQYVYLHEAVADALLFGTHYVFTKQFGEMFSFMSQKEKGETKSNLEKQFELIEKSTRDTTSAGAAENVEYTNVETIQSESAAYRPKLKHRGSKFVQELGAMYIPNYAGKNTFLISMSPDKNTMEEFWSLVDDSHIKTIIMLTETSASCYQASCQLGASPQNGSKFSVNKIEEKIRKGFTERTFSFKESDREEEEYLTTVKQFEYTDWKDGSAVPGETKHMLDMISSVQKWQPHLSESQPILVHCSDGCKRSGIVCVLLNELQRIQYEGGHINILESVKMMKKRQKFLIPTYEQYRFCFDLILAHSNTTEVYANL